MNADERAFTSAALCKLESPVTFDRNSSTMLTTRLTYTFVLASSLLLAPALAFGAVPACVDMDAPSFSMLMDELFSPGE